MAPQIVNKSSWERGFAHGSIYKTELVDLADKVKGDDSVVFGTKPGDPKVNGKLDPDGLPPIGSVLKYGDPFYSYVNVNTGQAVVTFYRYGCLPLQVRKLKYLEKIILV